ERRRGPREYASPQSPATSFRPQSHSPPVAGPRDARAAPSAEAAVLQRQLRQRRSAADRNGDQPTGGAPVRERRRPTSSPPEKAKRSEADAGLPADRSSLLRFLWKRPARLLLSK